MKKLTIAVTALVFSGLMIAFAASADHHGHLTDDERAALIDLLESSRSDLETLAAKADGDMWDKKPSDDAWSVAGVVEHLALAEVGIFMMVQEALGNAEDPAWEESAKAGIDGIIATMGDRSQKFQAPPVFQPTGEHSREELLAKYATARAHTLDFIRGTSAPLKLHMAEGPPGKLNAQQWLALMGAHNNRHNDQIREVLETIGG